MAWKKLALLCLCLSTSLLGGCVMVAPTEVIFRYNEARTRQANDIYQKVWGEDCPAIVFDYIDVGTAGVTFEPHELPWMRVKNASIVQFLKDHPGLMKNSDGSWKTIVGINLLPQHIPTMTLAHEICHVRDFYGSRKKAGERAIDDAVNEANAPRRDPVGPPAPGPALKPTPCCSQDGQPKEQVYARAELEAMLAEGSVDIDSPRPVSRDPRFLADIGKLLASQPLAFFNNLRFHGPRFQILALQVTLKTGIPIQPI